MRRTFLAPGGGACTPSLWAWLIDTVYTRVQVERVYKSNPIFEAKNTTFLEKVWFFSFHQLNKINRWSGIQG